MRNKTPIVPKTLDICASTERPMLNKLSMKKTKKGEITKTSPKIKQSSEFSTLNTLLK